MKTTLTIILALVAFAGMGQTKIGNITIPDSLAKRYFLDCYTHPDTVSEKSPDEGIYVHRSPDGLHSWSDPISQQEVDLKKQMASEYNTNLRNSAIGKYREGRWFVPRKPTEIDFIKWLSKQPK